MNQLIPPSLLEEFVTDEVVDFARYVDNCQCQCRRHFTIKDGLLNVHGKPIFDRLLVRGDLFIEEGAAGLRRLPKLLVVTGSINLKLCTALEVLPERMFAGGKIILDGTPIRNLPDELVAQALHVDSCANLRSINKGVQVAILYAARCSKLTDIADGFECGLLDLTGCPIEALPSHLQITNELRLRDCARLRHIPEGVTVENAIDVRGCSSLFTLPRSMQPSVAITDGMMLARDLVVVPTMSAEEASMCLGVKGIEAFPHHHFKNLAQLQERVIEVDRQPRGLRRFSALGVLATAPSIRPSPDQLRLMSSRFDRRATALPPAVSTSQ